MWYWYIVHPYYYCYVTIVMVQMLKLTLQSMYIQNRVTGLDKILSNCKRASSFTANETLTWKFTVLFYSNCLFTFNVLTHTKTHSYSAVPTETVIRLLNNSKQYYDYCWDSIIILITGSSMFLDLSMLDTQTHPVDCNNVGQEYSSYPFSVSFDSWTLSSSSTIPLALRQHKKSNLCNR